MRLTESRLRQIIREELLRESKAQSFKVADAAFTVEYLGYDTDDDTGKLNFKLNLGGYKGSPAAPAAYRTHFSGMTSFDAEDIAYQLIDAVSEQTGLPWAKAEADAGKGPVLDALEQAINAMASTIEPDLDAAGDDINDYAFNRY